MSRRSKASLRSIACVVDEGRFSQSSTEGRLRGGERERGGERGGGERLRGGERGGGERLRGGARGGARGGKRGAPALVCSSLR